MPTTSDVERLMDNLEVESSVHTDDVDESEDETSNVEPDVDSDEEDTEVTDMEEDDSSEEEESGGEHPQDDEDIIRSDDDADDEVSDSLSDTESTTVTKNKRKRKSPNKWVREVKFYQNTTNLLIPKKSFERLVREIGDDYKTELRFTAGALDAIQVASEEMLVQLLDTTQRLAIFRGGETIEPRDMRFVCETQFKWLL